MLKNSIDLFNLFYRLIVFVVILNYTKSQDCVDSRLRSGKCITLAQCPDIIEEFYDEARKTSYGIDFQTFISNSICGFDGIHFMICCRSRILPPQQLQNTPSIFGSIGRPISPPAPVQTTNSNTFQFAPLSGPSGNVLSTQTTTLAPTMQTSKASSTTTASVFQPVPGQGVTQKIAQPDTSTTTSIPQIDNANTCGVSRGTTNRVVGGVEAKRGTYTWIAALGYRDVPSSLKFLCAGSLISSKYVITSAHCVNANLILVRLGAHDLTNPAESDARDYRVKRTVTHDSFDLKSISNDIALIELTEQVVMTNYISIICLPESENFLTQEFIGMNPFVAGWGSTKHQGATSNVLRDVQVPIVSRQTCEQSYRTVFNFVEFSEKLICAGNSNVDACQGDSGGPLMLPQMDGSTYRYYLLGVVSYGYECARAGFPGVYTRVALYVPWIKKNMT